MWCIQEKSVKDDDEDDDEDDGESSQHFLSTYYMPHVYQGLSWQNLTHLHARRRDCRARAQNTPALLLPMSEELEELFSLTSVSRASILGQALVLDPGVLGDEVLAPVLTELVCYSPGW